MVVFRTRQDAFWAYQGSAGPLGVVGLPHGGSPGPGFGPGALGSVGLGVVGGGSYDEIAPARDNARDDEGDPENNPSGPEVTALAAGVGVKAEANSAVTGRPNPEGCSLRSSPSGAYRGFRKRRMGQISVAWVAVGRPLAQ